MSKKKENGTGGKKALPLQLAEILREGHDGVHEFSQQRLVELLAEKYGVHAHRDTVKANLDLLPSYFPEISSRKGGKRVLWSWREPKPEPIFERSQARYLADSVIAARRIPPREKAALVDAVMSNAYGDCLPWDDVLSSFGMMANSSKAVNPKYLYTVETLAECIGSGAWVIFRFGGVDRDGAFEKALPEEGERGPVVPLSLIASNGNYYLECRYPGKEKVYHYRVDLIHDARAVEPEDGGPAGPAPVNVDRYRDEHPLMFTGTVKVTVAVRDDPSSRLHFFDVFGSRAKLVRQDGDRLVYEVKANPTAARILALQLADDIEVLAPQDVRDAALEAAYGLVERYGRAPREDESE